MTATRWVAKQVYWLLMFRCSSAWNVKAGSIFHSAELLLGVSNWEAHGEWYYCTCLYGCICCSFHAHILSL